eukprot:9492448-Pyramimonas_sp.AAC.2
MRGAAQRAAPRRRQEGAAVDPRPACGGGQQVRLGGPAGAPMDPLVNSICDDDDDDEEEDTHVNDDDDDGEDNDGDDDDDDDDAQKREQFGGPVHLPGADRTNTSASQTHGRYHHGRGRRV